MDWSFLKETLFQLPSMIMEKLTHSYSEELNKEGKFFSANIIFIYNIASVIPDILLSKPFIRKVKDKEHIFFIHKTSYYDDYFIFKSRKEWLGPWKCIEWNDVPLDMRAIVFGEDKAKADKLIKKIPKLKAFL